MIKEIIKRNGDVEKFDSAKVNGWGEWAANTLGNNVNWGEIVLNAVAGLPEKCTSEQLQNSLIDTCLSKNTWSYNRMAGRLYISLLRKRFCGSDKEENLPTIKEVHDNLNSIDVMDSEFVNSFSDEDYEHLNKILKNSLDLTYSHYQIEQIFRKYSMRDRTKSAEEFKDSTDVYELPQYTFMRVAMRVMMNKPNRLKHIEKLYYYFSTNKINVPTPYFTNAGTKSSGFASCCVYKSGDTVQSLATGDHIAYTMTYSSAGIGGYIEARSAGEKIKGGLIEHKGKSSYYKALVGAIKANLQNGRGGACVVTFNAIEPEVQFIQTLRNQLTPDSKRINGLDYSMAFNRFFVEKAAKNEDIAVFSVNKAPEIYSALANPSEDFESLYNKAVEENRHSGFMNARDILVGHLRESLETGRQYYCNLTEANTHTPFKDPIYQHNLCAEVFLPTHEYNKVTELYEASEDVEGEIGLCSLAGIVLPNIKDDDEYKEVAKYCLMMIHTGIHESNYEFPHLKYTATSRNSAGVGIMGLAHYMAKNKLSYTTDEGKKKLHEIAETHYWHLVNASLELSKDPYYGKANWMDKTKWVDGWLPIDTYNKNVDAIASFENKREWESLRKEIVDNGGIHNSVLCAYMPGESSSLSSATTNSLYPIRNIHLIKTNDTMATKFVVPDSEKLNKYYEIAWNIPSKDIIEMYGIFQKWTDQGISGDLWMDVEGDVRVPTTKLLNDFFYTVKLGMKSRYYINSRTSKGGLDCEGCSI